MRAAVGCRLQEGGKRQCPPFKFRMLCPETGANHTMPSLARMMNIMKGGGWVRNFSFYKREFQKRGTAPQDRKGVVVKQAVKKKSQKRSEAPLPGLAGRASDPRNGASRPSDKYGQIDKRKKKMMMNGVTGERRRRGTNLVEAGNRRLPGCVTRCNCNCVGGNNKL